MTLQTLDPNTKLCIYCGLVKNKDQFGRDKTKKDKLHKYCKTCIKVTSSLYYYHNKKRNRPIVAIYHCKYPLRVHANKLAAKAEKEGKLISPNICEDCGIEDFSLHKHHTNYTEPLNVTWLCNSCHLARHKPKERVKIIDPDTQRNNHSRHSS